MRKKAPQGAVTPSHTPFYAAMVLLVLPLPLVLYLLVDSIRDGHWPGILFPAFLLCLDAALLLLLWRSTDQRMTITADGVETLHKRSGQRDFVPWRGYAYLYTLQGYKTSWYLFSASLMDKPAQYEAWQACMKSADRRAGDSYLLIFPNTMGLDGFRELLPPHIQAVPDWKCASFWDGYRKL